MRAARVLAAAVFSAVAGLAVVVFAAQKQDGPSDLFKQYCAKCHGEDGTANTPKGKQLKARNFTDSDWQSSKSDGDLIKVVTAGGEDMPPFGKKLSQDEIASLIKSDVRGFAKK